MTFKQEIGDYAPQVVEFTNDMLLDHAFLAWVKKFVCFPAGTPVVVGREGDRWITRAIETLRPGDKVLARDEFGTAVGLCPILAVSEKVAARIVRVSYRGADEAVHQIRCTPGHPFWVAERGDYVCADELLPGDTLAGPDGERLTFFSAEPEDLPDAIPVYNFEVAEAHTYFVAPRGDGTNAVLVHNGLKCSGSNTHEHHTIPREIQGKLPPDVANHSDVRGRKGLPNRRTVDAEKHLGEVHDKKGISRKETGISGGKYNLRFQEEIEARGGYNAVTAEDLVEIRDLLVVEFDL